MPLIKFKIVCFCPWWKKLSMGTWGADVKTSLSLVIIGYSVLPPGPRPPHICYVPVKWQILFWEGGGAVKFCVYLEQNYILHQKFPPKSPNFDVCIIPAYIINIDINLIRSYSRLRHEKSNLLNLDLTLPKI